MPIEKIVVIEDEPAIRRAIEQQLSQGDHDVVAVETISAARELLAKDDYDLAFTGTSLSDGEGKDLLRHLQLRPQRPLVVVMASSANSGSAFECMRLGALDWLFKPFSSDQLLFTLKKAERFNRLIKICRFHSHDAACEMIGRSKAMEQLRDLIGKIAGTQDSVLIQGESGTGKELLARAIIRESDRADAPFIKVDCAALPENLLESELFGCEKGVFTGDKPRRDGRLELAHGGTILLDEVSQLSPPVQTKLLRVLQEQELQRIGGNRPIKVDVRVIATTNRQLEASVRRNEFRQDLYIRLNEIPITVPPLRDRREDIPLLSNEFRKRYVRKHGVRAAGISQGCLAALLSYDWPGNVHELQNVIERAVIICGEGKELQPEHLGFSIGSSLPSITTKPTTSTAAAGALFTPAELVPLDEVEKRHILVMLQACKGNRTHAARKLGISIRTLRNKLHEYGASGKEDPGDTEHKVAETRPAKLA